MLNQDIFKCVVENTPLVSIDFLIKRDNKYLLGKRKNPPAKDFYFTIGGRIFKNETIKDAQERILKDELNLIPDAIKDKNFLGIFEHFYKDSIFGDKVSTHYVNLAYEIEIKYDIKKLPNDQHNEYKWFNKEEILESDEVHKYVKNYFKGSKYV